jgi:hypothetical protein
MPYILKALYLKIVIALVLKSLIGELSQSEVPAHFPTPLYTAIAALLKGPWQFWRFLGDLKPKNTPAVL